MGKKNKAGSDLGRSLIKDRFGGVKSRKFVADKSMLHTTELQDGYDWGRLNLQSVTEESSFQEFLSTAELAGTEFQAEKLNIKFVNVRSNVGLLTKEEKAKAKEAYNKNQNLIKIPRRPSWSSDTTAEELQQKEREKFLEWRRSLAQLQEDEGILLTPFEKNLEFWRQLWRVVERSDIVVQIVDARNPLLFRCEDLEDYVYEISKDKKNLILVNKADFLTPEQRNAWAKYFDSVAINFVFFSALLAEKPLVEEEEKVETESDAFNTENSPITMKDLKNDIEKLESAVEEGAKHLDNLMQRIDGLLKDEDIDVSTVVEQEKVDELTTDTDRTRILSRDELITFFKTFHKGKKVTENLTTVGLVGYPNVGKSSTINALLTLKKVSVSATPGKTKHFQTLYLDKELLLCDCPGLVMPSFVYTKAEMITNGILPIDQMRDHVPPINLVCNLIPRHVLEDKYGFMLPLPLEGEDESRCPTAEELLNAYGYNRGFMTANGQPDNPRAARYILKDFVNGKLLYAYAPLGVEQTDFHFWPVRQKTLNSNRVAPPMAVRAVKSNKPNSEDVDKMFFASQSEGFHVKGTGLVAAGSQSSMKSATDKPWKQINKHQNKKKREKLRRVYAHLDQH